MSAEDELKTSIAGVPGFENKGHEDKVRMFAWLQHSLRKRRDSAPAISTGVMTHSYQPGNTSQYLKNMEGKELLKDNRGYRCEGKFLANYNQLYGEHDITVNVRQLVKDLLNLMPELGEKDIFAGGADLLAA